MDQTNSKGYTALAWAVFKGNARVVKVLVKEGRANLDILYQYDGDQATALHITVVSGDVEVARLLVEAGADVEIKTSLFGVTACGERAPRETWTWCGTSPCRARLTYVPRTREDSSLSTLQLW